MTKYIIKASGEQEPFSVEKFQRSLRKAGADEPFIQEMVTTVLADSTFQTTKDIYRFALTNLRKKSPPLAARYNIKQAISELGPSGFPFEQFIARLFQAMGYHTETNQLVTGACATHEIDIILTNKKTRTMVECKFHQPYHMKCDTKVTLYTKARFNDIAQKETSFTDVWLVTNTKFTNEAIAYGTCAGINLIGWAYPTNNSLAHLIDRYGMHPITALTTLSRRQKRSFMEHGLVLCKDAPQHASTLKNLGLSPAKIDKLIKESSAICQQG